MVDWQSLFIGLASPTLVFLGVWITQQGKKAERQAAREQTIQERMDKLEEKLDKIQSHLRAEQRFSHRLILTVQKIIFFLREEEDYRNGNSLPGYPPPLPDVTELEEVLQERPTYNPHGG